MRIFGILAVFMLAIAAVGEGAYLVHLAGKVNELEARLQERPADMPVAARAASAERVTAVARVIGEVTRGPVPSFQATAPAATTPATATLREALGTTEGREQLKTALSIIEEERRQDRMVKRAEKVVERDQRFRQRLLEKMPLNGDEPARLESMYTTLQGGRRQVIEDMRAGLKNAQQADDEMDRLEEEAEKGVRTMLGEERWRKLREGDRQDRRQRDQQPPAPPGSVATVPPQR